MGWAFGIDSNNNGRFDLFVVLNGAGGNDRIEMIDQDGTILATTLLQDNASGTSVIFNSPTLGPTFARADRIGGATADAVNDPCGNRDPDWYITMGLPLPLLREYGALGGVVAYGGTSSNLTGIQSDLVCEDGFTDCTTGAACPSGVCLLPAGTCAPSVPPVFLGCVDDATGRTRDTGCSAATPICQVSSGSTFGDRCVACLTGADCNDGNACTADSCSAGGACVNTPVSAGTSCTGGICNGSSTAPACVICTDTASGLGTDSGCEGRTYELRGKMVCNMERRDSLEHQVCAVPTTR